MPTILTHKLAADETLERIQNPRISQTICAHMDAYYSGSQGGDYFYLYHYYFFMIKYLYKMYGWALHYTRPTQFFMEAARYVKEQDSDVLRAFLYGYVTHYCLDYLIHPHINKGTKPMSTHNTLECAIDVMYAQSRGVDAMTLDRGQFVRDSFVETGEIDAFFEHMKHLYDGIIRTPNYAYRDAYRYYAGFQDSICLMDEKKLKHLKRVNLISQLDMMTMLYHPPEEIKTWYDYDFYFDLLHQATLDACKKIGLLDAYFFEGLHPSVLESSFYNISFHGKPIVPREERKVFARLYRRAPLKWGQSKDSTQR